jgi:hypothetical protein
MFLTPVDEDVLCFIGRVYKEVVLEIDQDVTTELSTEDNVHIFLNILLFQETILQITVSQDVIERCCVMYGQYIVFNSYNLIIKVTLVDTNLITWLRETTWF